MIRAVLTDSPVSGAPRVSRPTLVEAAALLTTLALLAAVGVWWLEHTRRGQLFDIDESGYQAMALAQLEAWRSGGWSGWLAEVRHPSAYAVLVPAVTAPVLALLGPDSVHAMLVPLGFSLATVALGYLLGRRIAGRAGAVLTAGGLLASPLFVDYSRMYSFASASAAFAVLALLLVSSGGGVLLGRLHSVLAGAAVGLFVLSRTMNVAFLPAFAAIAVLSVLAGPERRTRAGNAVLAAVAAALVAGPWYWVSRDAVADYLLGVGYGERSREYGESQSAVLPSSWLETLRYALESNQLLSVAWWLLGLVGVVVVAARLAVRAARAGRLRVWLGAACRSPLMPVLVWVGFGLVMLTSTGTKGTGFLLPFAPGFAALTAWVVVRLATVPRRVAYAYLAGTVAVQLLAANQWLPDALRPDPIRVPGIGTVVVVHEQPLFDRSSDSWVAAVRPDLTTREAGARWVRLNLAVAEQLAADDPPVLTTFGFRHQLINPNSLRLAQLRTGLPVSQVASLQPELVTSLQTVTEELSVGSLAGTCRLLTARGEWFEFEPRLDQALVTRAAWDTGFTPVGVVELPDGRKMREWQRRATCPPQGTVVLAP